jgi:hypothetical protein
MIRYRKIVEALRPTPKSPWEIVDRAEASPR